MTIANERLWLLPPGVDELLPPEAGVVERLRRDLLDEFERWGYDLVTPPLVEHFDALATGAGADLQMEVFPLTDQLTGKLLGVRTDMTTQVARIDARRSRDASGAPPAARLSYVGSVLRARAGNASASRNPMQVGADLYGHAGVESDFESISLMLRCLERAGISPLHLDLGHVGVYGALVATTDLDADQREALHAALQRKSVTDVDAVFGDGGADNGTHSVSARWIRSLVGLHGATDVIDIAREALCDAPAEVAEHLAHLETLATAVERRHPAVDVHIDLAELRGFRYHTGTVFAAFTPGYGREIARGGRYDGIGLAFGASRPATGFSAELRLLATLAQRKPRARRRVLAPAMNIVAPDMALEAAVDKLRSEGVTVARALPGTAAAADFGAGDVDELRQTPDGAWQLS